ncbi:hypothetical protein ABZ071_35235, partial [Micromonospora fulviviridis]
MAQISAALKRARRHDVPAKAAAIQQAPRTTHRRQPGIVTGACAATVRATAAVLQTLNAEIRTTEGQAETHFGQHPDAEVYLSQPGLGAILGDRVLAKFGDAPGRYTDATSRKKYPAPPRSPADPARPMSLSQPRFRRWAGVDRQGHHAQAQVGEGDQ